MTQELIANMLGVRREGVTEGGAEAAEAPSMIRYCARPHHRARPAVAWKQRTCECYAVVKKEYDRLLPDRPAE